MVLVSSGLISCGHPMIHAMTGKALVFAADFADAVQPANPVLGPHAGVPSAWRALLVRNPSVQ
jgi:hypothetical protein